MLFLKEEGFAKPSCEHKPGKVTDDIQLMLLCMGDQDDTLTNDTKAFTILAILFNSGGLNLHAQFTEAIEDYNNTLYECTMHDGDDEPSCVAYDSLTFYELIGTMGEPVFMFEDY